MSGGGRKWALVNMITMGHFSSGTILINMSSSLPFQEEFRFHLNRFY